MPVGENVKKRTRPLTDRERRRVIGLYRRGLPVEGIAEATAIPRWRVFDALRESKELRTRGRPPISEEEIARRQRAAARVKTWREYGKLVGVASPRLDRRLGIRLQCFVPDCVSLSSTSLRGVDSTGAVRPVCAEHAAAFRREGRGTETGGSS